MNLDRAMAKAGGALGSFAGGIASGFAKQARASDPVVSAMFNTWERTSGIPHTEDLTANLSAYEVSWIVYSCVYAIASQGASVPLVMYEKRGDDRRQWKKLSSHAILDLLANPNPDAMETDFDLIEAFLSDLELAGSWYMYVIRGSGGLPIRARRLRPDFTHVVPSKTRRVDGYVYKVGGKTIEFSAEEIVQSKTFHPTSDTEGLSSIAAAALPIMLDTKGMRYNARFFDNDASPRSVLKIEGRRDEVLEQKLKQDLDSGFKGSANAHKSMILWGGMDVKSTGISQKDMEFVLQSQMSEERIMACFHVPPGILGIMRYSNYANLVEQRRSFWHETMIPKLKKMERALTRGLCWPYDPSLVLEFDLTKVHALIEDALQMAQVDAALLGAKMYTVNERRRERGLEPVWWGDDPWIQMQDYQAQEGETGPPRIAAPAPAPAPPDPAADGAAPDDSQTSPQEGKSKKLPWGFRGKRLYQDARELEARVLAWEAVIAPSRAQFAKKVVGLLEKQEAEVVGKMRAEKRSLAQIRGVVERRAKNLAEGHDVTPDILKDATLAEILTWLFKQDEWIEISRNAVHPTLLNAANVAGTFAIGEVGVGMDFNLVSARIQQAIKDKELVFAQHWNESTLGELRGQLAEGVLQGEPMNELIARVQGVFDGEKNNANVVAQTEVGAVSNAASHEGYVQSGVVRGKEWRNASQNPRPHHLVVDGVFASSGLPAIVPLDASFTVGGESLMYPGDPSGRADNVCGCHCIELPVLEEGV